MKVCKLFALALVALSTPVAAEDRPLYNAQETVRNAQIGTHSLRLAPPVKVQPYRGSTMKGSPGYFDRMDCKVEPVGEPKGTIICKPRRTN